MVDRCIIRVVWLDHGEKLSLERLPCALDGCVELAK